MDKPKVASPSPVSVELEGEKNYFYCTCGMSGNQPFCDGTHQGTEFTPLKFTVEESSEKWLCRCKQTGNAPFCDGTHKQLG